MADRETTFTRSWRPLGEDAPMEFVTDGMLYAFAGIAGGVVLGLAARWGRFCVGRDRDLLYGDDTRMRMWGLAMATAMGATLRWSVPESCA